MKKLTILFFALIATSLVYGQFGFTSSLKLIEKENYLEAEKKILKELQKTPNDIEENYSLARLLIRRNYKGYNPEKSYDYLQKSKKLFENITVERDLKKFSKIPISKELYQDYTDTICRHALENAEVKNLLATYERYLTYYLEAPENYKQRAAELRNIAAFVIACEINTVESYQDFITKYSSAIQTNGAVLRRNALAFNRAKSVDNIGGYKAFIASYPNAEEINQARERIYELAFTQAEKENSSDSYKKYIDEYPESRQYSKAFSLFEKMQFLENTTAGDWIRYRTFIANFPNNSWKAVAQDSLLSIGVRTENMDVLSYCVENFKSANRNKALLLYHDIFTIDGEKQTLDMFYAKYTDEVLNEVKAKDYELARLGNELALQLPYNPVVFSKYDNYIRLAAPRDKAFMALQRMIAQDITDKNFREAITKINIYSMYFGTRNKKLKDLVSFFESQENAVVN